MKTATFTKDSDGTVRVLLWKRDRSPVAKASPVEKKPSRQAQADAIVRALVSRALGLIRVRQDGIGTAAEAAASVLRSDWGRSKRKQFEDLTGSKLSAGRLARLVAEVLTRNSD